MTRERRLEVGLGLVLVATVAVATAALRLPRAPDGAALPPGARDVAVELAAEPAAAAIPGPRAAREVWEAIDAARSRGVICAGRPLPPVPELRGSRPLDVAALGGVATGQSDDPAAAAQARVRHAKFKGKLVAELRVAGPATPAEAVGAWLASPDDCPKLMDPTATHGGVAIVPDPAGTVWVVVLAHKR